MSDGEVRKAGEAKAMPKRQAGNTIQYTTREGKDRLY
jgi:hypothetical protein